MQWFRNITTTGMGVFNRPLVKKSVSGQDSGSSSSKVGFAQTGDASDASVVPFKSQTIMAEQAAWVVTRSMQRLEMEQIEHKSQDYTAQPLDEVMLEELIGQESEQFMYQDLVKAVRKNDARSVLGYLEKGGKLSRKSDTGQSLLHIALDADAVDAAAVLLDAGADVNEYDPHTGEYPIHKASTHQNYNAICELIKNGAELNVFNGAGLTPLHISVQAAHAEIAGLLMNSGADLELPDSHNQNTPLHFSVKVAAIPIVNDLINRKINPNPKNKSGSTPLHNAICYAIRDNQENRLRVITALLAGGADLYSANSSGETVMDVVKNASREPGFRTPFVQILSTCSLPVSRSELLTQIQGWLGRQHPDSSQE